MLLDRPSQLKSLQRPFVHSVVAVALPPLLLEVVLAFAARIVRHLPPVIVGQAKVQPRRTASLLPAGHCSDRGRPRIASCREERSTTPSLVGCLLRGGFRPCYLAFACPKRVGALGAGEIPGGMGMPEKRKLRSLVGRNDKAYNALVQQSRVERDLQDSQMKNKFGGARGTNGYSDARRDNRGGKTRCC